MLSHKAAYAAATDGSTLEITAAEYTALQSSITNQTNAGQKDSPSLYTTQNDWGNNGIGFTATVTGAAPNGTVTGIVPANNWIFAWAFKSGTAQTGRQYRLQVLNTNTTTGGITVSDISGVTNTAAQMKYFVIKGGYKVTSAKDLAVFGGSFTYASIANHQTWYGTTIGSYPTNWTTNSIYVQALTTSVKQW